MIVAVFLGLLMGALGLGAWIATRIYTAQTVQCGIPGDFDRDRAIDDAADMAITADDWDRDSWWSA